MTAYQEGKKFYFKKGGETFWGPQKKRIFFLFFPQKGKFFLYLMIKEGVGGEAEKVLGPFGAKLRPHEEKKPYPRPRARKNGPALNIWRHYPLKPLNSKTPRV